MANAGIGENLETIRNLLNIEAPTGDDEVVTDEDDILRHNLYGIHIKEKNDALSDTNPHICIGWSVLGDITTVNNKEELTSIYDEHIKKNNRGRGQDIGQIWRFIHDINIGDYVIFAENSVFHIGRVESDNYYDDNVGPNQDLDYTNNRKVVWLKKNISRKILSENMHNSLKTAMSVFGINDYKAAVVDLLKGSYQKDDSIDIEDGFELNYETNVDIPYERNRIVFGAPGTGKSYLLKEDCAKVQNLYEGAEIERVTFHPDYSYSQFVGTYKPVMDENNEKITYEYVPGPFMSA